MTERRYIYVCAGCDREYYEWLDAYQCCIGPATWDIPYECEVEDDGVSQGTGDSSKHNGPT